MEATIFTGRVYGFLASFAAELKVAHPEMLKAITTAKKKNDRADAAMIADLLRVNLLPEGLTGLVIMESIASVTTFVYRLRFYLSDGGRF